jgi:polyhydroxybutyrate depolymerase
VAAALATLVLAVVLLAGRARAAATTRCGATPAPSARTLLLEVGGHRRRALLHLPPLSAGRPIPLLIALHGYGGNGPGLERDTGFSTLADRDHFAVVYPDSMGVQWDISGSARDVRFIAAVIVRVEQDACIDPNRVYATGVSNGGGMAARLGCDLSGEIAAIAPVAGGYRSLPPCNPDRPMSVLEMHGTQDTTVPYSGRGADHAGAVLPFMFAWAIRDGCQMLPSKAVVASHTLRYLWTGCSEGSSVEQLKLFGVGHGWPGAVGAGIRSPGPPSISATTVVWRFLSAHTLSPPPS